MSRTSASIYSELKSMGYRRRALMKTIIIVIRGVNMTKRLRWAEERINWAPEMWNMLTN